MKYFGTTSQQTFEGVLSEIELVVSSLMTSEFFRHSKTVREVGLYETFNFEN